MYSGAMEYIYMLVHGTKIYPFLREEDARAVAEQLPDLKVGKYTHPATIWRKSVYAPGDLPSVSESGEVRPLPREERVR